MGRWTHGALFEVVIAEDGESPTLPEPGSLPKGVIVHRHRHDDGRRVRGAGGEVLVHVAQPPLAGLGDTQGGGLPRVQCEPQRAPGKGRFVPPSPAGCLPSRLTCEAICWKYRSRGKRCQPSSSLRLCGL